MISVIHGSSNQLRAHNYKEPDDHHTCYRKENTDTSHIISRRQIEAEKNQSNYDEPPENFNKTRQTSCDAVFRAVAVTR